MLQQLLTTRPHVYCQCCIAQCTGQSTATIDRLHLYAVNITVSLLVQSDPTSF